MRLLVPVVSLLVAASPACAQPKSPQAAPLTSAKANSIPTVQLQNGALQTDADTAKQILASPTLRAKVEMGLADARASMHGCFAMRVYAPEKENSTPSARPLVNPKPYVPTQMRLKTTCSFMPDFRPVPLSVPKVQR